MAGTSFLESLYQEELYRIREKVLVVIPTPWQTFTEEEKVLLIKILGSVKLSLSAVQIVEKKEFKAEDFAAFSPSYIITFGSVLTGSSKKYDPIVIGSTSILVADAVSQLDDLKKRNLWLSLKQVFQL